MIVKPKINIDRPNKQGEAYILLSINCKPRFRISTGLKIKASNWNSTTSTIKPSEPNHDIKSIVLTENYNKVEKVLLRLSYEGIEINKDNVLKELKGNQTKPEDKFLTDHFNDYIEEKQTTTSANTQKVYKTTLKHLMNYEGKQELRLTFTKIDSTFYNTFLKYLLKDAKLFNNAAGKYIKTFKTFMNWAHEKGYHDNTKFKKFKVLKEERDIFPLSLEDYKTLEETKLEPHLAKVRDLLLFECYTGLRYSDTQKLKAENIEGNRLVLRTIKTKQKLTIPLTTKAKEILDRYLDPQTKKLSFPSISNQKANEHLKDIGKAAKFFEKVTAVRYQGAKRIEESFPKYKKLSTHTGRQSFITNSLLLGMKPEVVMAIVGHDTYENFKRYIKFTDKDLKNQIDVWNK